MFARRGSGHRQRFIQMHRQTRHEPRMPEAITDATKIRTRHGDGRGGIGIARHAGNSITRTMLRRLITPSLNFLQIGPEDLRPQPVPLGIHVQTILDEQFGTWLAIFAEHVRENVDERKVRMLERVVFN